MPYRYGPAVSSRAIPLDAARRDATQSGIMEHTVLVQQCNDIIILQQYNDISIIMGHTVLVQRYNGITVLIGWYNYSMPYNIRACWEREKQSAICAEKDESNIILYYII